MSNGPANKKLSEAITKTLPFLRRYARAVTGSQQRGDEWVRLCAEVAVRQPDLIEGADDTKLGVFALFHRLQQPFGGLDQPADGGSVSGRLKESLTEMAPLQRQVLLLTVLEGFTTKGGIERDGVLLAIKDARASEVKAEVRAWLKRLKISQDQGEK